MFGHGKDEIIVLFGNGIGAKVDEARNWSIQAGLQLTGPGRSNGRIPTKGLACRHIEDVICSSNAHSRGGDIGCAVGKTAIAFTACLYRYITPNDYTV